MNWLRALCHSQALRFGAGVLAIAACLPAAAADTVEFFGTWMNTNPTAGPIAECGGGLGVINKNAPPQYHSAGFSNLGGFVFNLVQCFAPVPKAAFELDFGGGNMLVGTWASVATPTSTPMLFQLVGTADVTGGTGSFQGYTGSFAANGYIDRRPVADSAFVFRGQLVPVPEPATWSLMLAGVAALAMTVWRRRSGQNRPR